MGPHWSVKTWNEGVSRVMRRSTLPRLRRPRPSEPGGIASGRAQASKVTAAGAWRSSASGAWTAELAPAKDSACPIAPGSRQTPTRARSCPWPVTSAVVALPASSNDHHAAGPSGTTGCARHAGTIAETSSLQAFLSTIAATSAPPGTGLARRPAPPLPGRYTQDRPAGRMAVRPVVSTRGVVACPPWSAASPYGAAGIRSSRPPQRPGQEHGRRGTGPPCSGTADRGHGL